MEGHEIRNKNSGSRGQRGENYLILAFFFNARHQSCLPGTGNLVTMTGPSIQVQAQNRTALTGFRHKSDVVCVTSDLVRPAKPAPLAEKEGYG